MIAAKYRNESRMKMCGLTALTAALLFPTTAMASLAPQEDLEARRAAAHALGDEPLDLLLRQGLPLLRQSLPVVGVDPAERDRMHSALDEMSLLMIRHSQATAANLLAERFTLQELKDGPDDARMGAALEEVSPAMRAAGQQLVFDVIRQGCTALPQPSVRCAEMLMNIRDLEAAR